jgi:hypothetical protein
MSIVMMAMMIDIFNILNVQDTSNGKERENLPIHGFGTSMWILHKMCTSRAREKTDYVFSLV